MLRKMMQAIFIISLAFLAYSVNTCAAESQPAEYSDMPSGWSKDAMSSAISNGYMCGYDGKIYPKSYLTRAQLAAVTNRVFGTDNMADISDYTDVSAGAWYYDDIAYAVDKETMVGSNDRIFPERNATREEVFAVLARAINLQSSDLTVLDQFSDADQISPWAMSELAAMISNGYMYGANGKLQPRTKITREEFAYVIDQFSDIINGQSLNEEYYKETTTPVEQFEAIDQIEAKVGSITLNKSQNVIKDQTIDSNVVIDNGIDGGELLLDNVVINGNIILNGGTLSSITLLNGSSVTGIIVSIADCTLTISGDSSQLNSITVNGVRNTIQVSNSIISHVLLSQTSDGASFTMQKGSKCELFEIASTGVSLSINEGSGIERLLVDETALDTVIRYDETSFVNVLEDKGVNSII